jgi:hypothetical protein
VLSLYVCAAASERGTKTDPQKEEKEKRKGQDKITNTCMYRKVQTYNKTQKEGRKEGRKGQRKGQRKGDNNIMLKKYVDVEREPNTKCWYQYQYQYHGTMCAVSYISS